MLIRATVELREHRRKDELMKIREKTTPNNPKLNTGKKKKKKND